MKRLFLIVQFLLFLSPLVVAQNVEDRLGKSMHMVMDVYHSPTESMDQRIARAANEFCNLLMEIDTSGDEGDAKVMELTYQAFLNLLVKGDRMGSLDEWNRIFASKLSVKHPLKLYSILCMAAAYKSCDNFLMETAVANFSFKGDGALGIAFLNQQVGIIGNLTTYDRARVEASKADLQLFSGQVEEAAKSFKNAAELMREACGKESPCYFKFHMYEELPQAYKGDFKEAYAIAKETKDALSSFEHNYVNLGRRVIGLDFVEYAALLARLSIYCGRLGSSDEEMSFADAAINAAYDNMESSASMMNQYSFDGMPINGPDVYLERNLFSIKLNYAENLYKAKRVEDSKTVFKELLSDYRNDMNNTAQYSALDVQQLQKKMEPLISLAPLCVNRFLGDSDIAELAYNCALQYKNFSLMTENLLLKLVKSEGDKEVYGIYQQILDLKNRQDRVSKEEAVSINDSIRTLNEKLMLDLDFSTYGKILSVDWHEIQENLSSEAVAIEFIVGKDEEEQSVYFANILKKDSKPYCVKLCKEKALSSILSPYTTSQAYKLLWEPLIDHFADVTDIYFSPTGLLHKIAIEYLPDDNQNLMNSRYKIYRLSSTREIAMRKGMQGSIRHAVVYGGVDYNYLDQAQLDDNSQDEDFVNDEQLRDGMSYLPQTLVEMANIEKVLSPRMKVDTICGRMATEASFKQLSGEDIQIVHLSTHGFYAPKYKRSNFTKVTLNPFNSLDEQSLSRSGLLLAGANKSIKLKHISGDDGILTAKEIARLDLGGVELVTLSACETALGDLSGEGVFGLQRGFKKAGAKAMIMSLWRVDDTATRILMTTFYDLLSKGLSINDAFTQSQHQLLLVDNGKYSDPKFWAAFIMIDAL